MNRPAFALASSLAIAVAVATPARADDPFGKPGDVLIGGLGSYLRSRDANPSDAYDTFTLTPRIDFVFAPRWFIGVVPGVSYERQTTQVTQADGSTVATPVSATTLDIGLRFGRFVPITDSFALRPVATIAVADTLTSANAAPTFTDLGGVTASAHLEALLAITDRFFVTTSFGLGSVTIRSSGTTANASLGGTLGFGIEGRL